jgi:hypothetical protein
MNGCYLKGEAITPDEAAVALRLILTRSSAPDSWKREMAALRQAARDILVVRVARPPSKSPTSTATTVRPMPSRKRGALSLAMLARRTYPKCHVIYGYCLPTSLGMCILCAYPDDQRAA